MTKQPKTNQPRSAARFRFRFPPRRRGSVVTLHTHVHLPPFDTTGIFGSPSLLEVRRVASRLVCFSRSRARRRARAGDHAGAASWASRPAIRILCDASRANGAAARVAASRVGSARGSRPLPPAIWTRRVRDAPRRSLGPESRGSPGMRTNDRPRVGLARETFDADGDFEPPFRSSSQHTTLRTQRCPPLSPSTRLSPSSPSAASSAWASPSAPASP